MLYSALCRAGKALGYAEAWTYTLPDEPGTSLRAAGFVDMGLTDGGEWDRPSRRRSAAVRPERKRRWMRALTQFPRPVDDPHTAINTTPSAAPRAGAVRGSRGLSVRTSHALHNATETD